jgi:hypothetical protein
LSTRSIHIACWVTRASISESCLAIEYLESFFDWERSISIVIVRVFIIVEIFFDGYLDTIKCIDYISECSKIQYYIMLYRFSCYFWYFVCKEWYSFFLTESYRI